MIKELIKNINDYLYKHPTKGINHLNTWISIEESCYNETKTTHKQAGKDKQIVTRIVLEYMQTLDEHKFLELAYYVAPECFKKWRSSDKNGELTFDPVEYIHKKYPDFNYEELNPKIRNNTKAYHKAAMDYKAGMDDSAK